MTFIHPTIHPIAHKARRLLAVSLLLALVLPVAACAAPRDATPLDVEFPLKQYALTMSLAPGLPFEITSVEGAEVRVTVDGGSWLRWGYETASVVETKGLKTSFTATTGATTVYWSPFSGTDGTETGLPTEAEVVVTASIAGRSTSTVRIAIRSQDGFYTPSVK
jgi:hypothetical protein